MDLELDLEWFRIQDWGKRHCAKFRNFRFEVKILILV